MLSTGYLTAGVRITNAARPCVRTSFAGSPSILRLHTFRSRPRWQTLANPMQQQRDYRQGFNYQRFQSTSNILQRWAARPTFYYEIGGGALVICAFYTYNLEEVPVSGRRRFNIVSPESEQAAGKQMYQQTMQEFGGQILPRWHPKVRQVQRVLDRLIPNSGLEHEDWEVHVIEDEMQNAFVIPGGKVFVFSGILDVCADDDGLATVLGHEISHNIAHHAAERMSQGSILTGIALLLSALFGVDIGFGRIAMDLAFTRPGSRAQESEADYIGLLMMAESCYDPEKALGFWDRMEKQEQVAIPQFMSTHPSNHNRVEKIKQWLNEAEMKREQSGCGAIGGFARDFQSTIGFSKQS